MVLTKDSLQIYEFVHTGSQELYNNNQNAINVQYLGRFIFFMNSIQKNNEFVRNEDNECPNLPIWNTTNPDYNFRSCDPILFNYTLIDNPYENKTNSILDTYNYNPEKYTIMYESLRAFGLEDLDITTFIAETLILPELNLIGGFKESLDSKSVVTNNYNIKAYSLNGNIFENSLHELENKYTDIKENIDFVKSLFTIDSYQSRHTNINKSPNFLSTGAHRVVYITKLLVEKGTKICLFGDVHGSIHAVLRSILRLISLGFIGNNFILREDFKIIFLGDLVDRNLYSIEMIYFVIKLKLLNPDKVYIIRGNHEDCSISTKYHLHEQFKKLDEVNYKKLYALYCRTWLHLPVAIFLTYDNEQYIQLCHGGIYSQVSPITAFLNSNSVIKVFSNSNLPPSQYEKIMDFQEVDFIIENLSDDALARHVLNDNYGRKLPKERKKIYLNEINRYIELSKIRGIIRGHQDMFNNTKLLFMVKKESLKIRNHTEEIPKIELYPHKELIQSTDKISSFTIPLLSDSKYIHEYYERYKFSPVITLTTGTPSRFTDGDGFAILNLDRPEELSESSRKRQRTSHDDLSVKPPEKMPRLQEGAYRKYKQKYLNLKNKNL